MIVNIDTAILIRAMPRSKQTRHAGYWESLRTIRRTFSTCDLPERIDEPTMGLPVVLADPKDDPILYTAVQ